MTLIFGSPEAAAILQQNKHVDEPIQLDMADDDGIIDVDNPYDIDQLEKRLKRIDGECDDLGWRIQKLEDELYGLRDEENVIKARIKELKTNPQAHAARKLTASDLAAWNAWVATGTSSIWIPAEHQTAMDQLGQHYAI